MRPSLRHVVWPVLVVAALVGPQVSYGCSCIEEPKPRRARRQAQLVFAGRVLPSSNSIGVVRLEVLAVWKGIPVGQQEVEIFSELIEGCTYWFEAGTSHLVYAYDPSYGPRDYDSRTPPITTLCSRTKALSSASEEIGKLGAPEWSIDGWQAPDAA